MVNDRLQGHLRERVQLSLAQSLNKDAGGWSGGFAREAEQLGWSALRLPRAPGPCHTDERKAFAGFGVVHFFFLKIFVFFPSYFHLSALRAVCTRAGSSSTRS